MTTATLNHPTNTAPNAEIYTATPVQGNFTGEPEQHVDCAAAMATIIVGDGFAAFEQWNDDVKHNYLWGLQREIIRAKKSLAAANPRPAERDTAVGIVAVAFIEAGAFGCCVDLHGADAPAMAKLAKRLSSIVHAIENDGDGDLVREGANIIRSMYEGLRDVSDPAEVEA